MNLDKTLTIFLADDDEDDTFLFQEALAHIPVSADLTISENGMELMKMLGSGERIPDLIFLDMNMPVKNGLECLTELRGSAVYQQVPIIILSTSTAGYLIESAYDAGANLYIQKPTSFSGLVHVLKLCLLDKRGWIGKPAIHDFLISNE